RTQAQPKRPPALRTWAHQSRRPDIRETWPDGHGTRSRPLRGVDLGGARNPRRLMPENRPPARFDARGASGLSKVVMLLTGWGVHPIKDLTTLFDIELQERLQNVHIRAKPETGLVGGPGLSARPGHARLYRLRAEDAQSPISKCAGTDCACLNSVRLADSNRIVRGLVIERRPRHRFLRVLRQDQVSERRFLALGRKTLVILEHAIDLHLQAAVFAIANIRRNFQPAIGSGPLLNA